MLELNTATTTTDADALIKDGSEQSFMQDVIETSQSVPVIVDFWAPWCGPCKTLGPALEAAVTAAKGAVKMVKLNVDENQAIAGQLQIQSIPTVYAFWQGKPVDGFQGAVPGSEIQAFVDRVSAMGNGAPDGGLEDALNAAQEMLADGDIEDAAQTFAAILEEEPSTVGAYAGLAQCYLAQGDLEQAEATLNGAPAAISTAPDLEAIYAQLELAKQASGAGPLGELQAAVEAEGDNHQARFDLAIALHAKGDAQAAVDHLLELFRRDREWNEAAAKTQLFTVFDACQQMIPLF